MPVTTTPIGLDSRHTLRDPDEGPEGKAICHVPSAMTFTGQGHTTSPAPLLMLIQVTWGPRRSHDPVSLCSMAPRVNGRVGPRMFPHDRLCRTRHRLVSQPQ